MAKQAEAENGWAIIREACRVMAKRLRDVCGLPESEPLLRAGRGFVVRALSWTVQKYFMKSGYSLLIAALLLPGCTKKSADTPPNDGNVHNVSTGGLPFAVTVVETQQDKEWSTLTRLSLSYFETQDYDALEKLAQDGRSAEDEWPNGDWQVVPVYAGLELSTSQDNSVWLDRQKAIEAWIQARPESITARVALARHLIDYAWKARGNGYANTVSDESEKQFEDRLNQAATVLNAAKDLPAKCPAYWTSEMKVALGLGISRAQYDQIFQMASQAFPDYTPIYIQRGMFLLPRWYGAEGEWVDDLTKSADQIGGEAGNQLYARVVWSLHGYSSQKNIFEENTNLSWERVDRGWSALEKQFPDSLEALEIHGHLAALAGDGKTAKQCLMNTGGKVALRAWSAKGEFIDFANWAQAQ